MCYRGKAAVGIARYPAADARRPSLFRQVDQVEQILCGGPTVDGLRPSPFLRQFVQILNKEIAGVK